MNAKDTIKHNLIMADRILNAYVGDLSDAELLISPGKDMNHIAWQFGHLISSERGMIEGIKPGSSPALPAGFDETHARPEKRPADAAPYLTKDEYFRLYNAQRAATLAAVEAISDAELDNPSPEGMAQIAPRVGSVLNLIGQHYLMHLGQFVPVRRATGKAIAI